MLDLSLEGIGDKRKQLIGAYFCHEYSYAAAALMNPSIVPHPDQSGLDKHTIRILMSLRAVGEGHISSIAFREGLVVCQGRRSSWRRSRPSRPPPTRPTRRDPTTTARSPSIARKTPTCRAR